MRTDRRHKGTSQPSQKDSRTEFQRDRDRILYSAAFRRLSGITQTAQGDLEHHVHNRLTHVLEVAQIGRRLAEHLLRDVRQRELAHNLSIDPDVVEAGCLAHDLGHPPFGHITEEVLDHIMLKDFTVSEGFEGNAQTFRVITKLAEHSKGLEGLNLTRATLNATLKYPWRRGDKPGKKWGYYSSEVDDFTFARQPHELHTRRKSAEAAIMDWADDIAYSVHDMLDFYEAGKIPLDRLGRSDDEIDRFLHGVQDAWAYEKLHVGESFDFYKNAFEGLVETFIGLDRPYVGDAEQRYALKKLSSVFIERYSTAVKLRQPGSETEQFVEIDELLRAEVVMLKELTWHYVIRDPALTSQQQGQRKIIESLFHAYEEALRDRRRWRLFPPRIREIAEAKTVEDPDNKDERCRLVCDLIAGMSEQQAQAMYHRLNGISAGSAFAMIVR